MYTSEISGIIGSTNNDVSSCNSYNSSSIYSGHISACNN